MNIKYLIYPPGIPPHADKLIFAADLVGYVCRFSLSMDDHRILTSVPYRDFVCNHFNDRTKRAVDFIGEVIEEPLAFEMNCMRDMKSESLDDFLMVINLFRRKFFPTGFNINNFLNYCVHLARAAQYFYELDFNLAPMIAVNYILKVFQGHDMANGGWKTLNDISNKLIEASRYLSIYLPSPASSVGFVTPTSGSPLANQDSQRRMPENRD